MTTRTDIAVELVKERTQKHTEASTKRVMKTTAFKSA